MQKKFSKNAKKKLKKCKNVKKNIVYANNMKKYAKIRKKKESLQKIFSICTKYTGKMQKA